MKRDSKATVYESLQGLYETILSLSDSRNRHKWLQAAHHDIAAALKETQTVRSWLGYETDEPFKRIKIREAQAELGAKLQNLK
ncbi:unnamed protein product [Euphydryas editha]|uniref:Uncharacterized protein n=1 Tax=Euphydryas editha TaxID=104508 RepID=A0AAU9V0Z0_EUPED|nr:unnamed protein product [Euphydryas editha]